MLLADGTTGNANIVKLFTNVLDPLTTGTLNKPRTPFGAVPLAR